MPSGFGTHRHPSKSLQKSVDFDLAACGEIDAAVDDNRDDEPGGKRGAVARAICSDV